MALSDQVLANVGAELIRRRSRELDENGRGLECKSLMRDWLDLSPDGRWKAAIEYAETYLNHAPGLLRYLERQHGA